METFYTLCAVIGGTVLVCQFLLTLLGLGGDHDVGGDHSFDVGHDGGTDAGHDGTHEVGHEAESSWLVGVLTFRTIVAALTFFGLAGLAALRSDVEQVPSFGAAALAGGLAMFVVAGVMRGLGKLRSEGTVHINRSVGRVGTVYLSVPGNRAGAGKVLLNLQNRTVEYQAVTAQDELPTGAKVVVVAVVNPNTIEVAPVPETADSGRVSHV
jgi:hypothetical protein